MPWLAEEGPFGETISRKQRRCARYGLIRTETVNADTGERKIADTLTFFAQYQHESKGMQGIGG